jgi:hypothetical protein
LWRFGWPEKREALSHVAVETRFSVRSTTVAESKGGEKVAGHERIPGGFLDTLAPRAQMRECPSYGFCGGCGSKGRKSGRTWRILRVIFRVISTANPNEVDAHRTGTAEFGRSEKGEAKSHLDVAGLFQGRSRCGGDVEGVEERSAEGIPVLGVCFGFGIAREEETGREHERDMRCLFVFRKREI